MGLAFSGELSGWPCGCDQQGTNPAGTGVQYVISLNGLQGLVTLAAGGGVAISSTGNSILIAADGSAGLGTVTTVNATSSNTNLVVTGGPVTTVGTFAFSLAGALNSISGLVTAANKMIYTTALDTYAVTDLTAFARTLLDDATASDARSTLGLVIGTNVQAFSQDLADFVTNASWTGANLTLAGSLTTTTSLTIGTSGFVTTDFGIGGDLSVIGSVSCGAITATSVSGVGSGLTALDAANISTGTLAVARGGTSFSSYTTGDSIYASGAGTLAKLTAGAAGTFYRFAGAGVAPVVSTLILPNAATVGDIFSSSTTNTMSRITAVATGNALISGGVATLPSWGKVTSSHVDSTIATISGGVNANISQMGTVTFTGGLTFQSDITVLSTLTDSSAFVGDPGNILTSTGTGVAWVTQVSLETLDLSGQLSLSGTITAAGVTGNRTINKQSGTVRFAAAATTIVITNSLALAASSRALATVCSNDTTLKSVNAVVTDGFITLNANAAATAETEVYWELRQII